MPIPTPTPADKFTFGLWTVGWQARDPFGDATRAALDPVEAVHRLAELGACGRHLPRRRPRPVRRRRRRAASATSTRFKDGARRDRVWWCRWSPPTSSPTRSSRTAGSPTTTARSAATRCARSCATSTWPPSSAPRPTCSGAAARAPRPTPPRTCAAALDRYREAIDLLAQYSIDQGYDLRFAIEPKPNEPRGDILLPTVGHALAFIDDPRAPRDGGPQPRGRARADGRS